MRKDSLGRHQQSQFNAHVRAAEQGIDDEDSSILIQHAQPTVVPPIDLSRITAARPDISLKYETSDYETSDYETSDYETSIEDDETSDYESDRSEADSLEYESDRSEADSLESFLYVDRNNEVQAQFAYW